MFNLITAPRDTTGDPSHALYDSPLGAPYQYTPPAGGSQQFSFIVHFIKPVLIQSVAFNMKGPQKVTVDIVDRDHTYNVKVSDWLCFVQWFLKYHLFSCFK